MQTPPPQFDHDRTHLPYKLPAHPHTPFPTTGEHPPRGQHRIAPPTYMEKLVQARKIPSQHINKRHLSQPTVILLYNGLKRTNDVPLTIAHMYTCGPAISCSVWGQKAPPERIFKPKTSVKWCLMRYICTQCGRERYICGANCIGDRHVTSVRRKSQKSQKKKHLLGNTHTPSNKTKQENTLYEKVLTTFGGMSTLRNGVEWILTWVACARHMLCWIFVTWGYKIHEHRPVAKK